MQLGWKWKGQPLVATAAGQNNGLLFVTNSVSKQQFLVDTEAEVSVRPATGLDMRSKQPGPPLLATNGSSIRTYGFCALSLNLAACIYTWEFTVAEVGANFLRSNSLLADLCGKRLVDAATYHSVPLELTISTHPMPHLDALSSSVNRYDKLLAHFPDITTLNFIQFQKKHGVEHFIPTLGPPVYARTCRLPPDKLAAAKAEFERMEVMGIICQSSSPWVSPLHITSQPSTSQICFCTLGRPLYSSTATIRGSIKLSSPALSF